MKKKIFTPIGKLMWVNIQGVGKWNYDKNARNYVADVIIDNEKSSPLVELIEEFYNESTKKGLTVKSLGYKFCDESGTVSKKENTHKIFRFKTRVEFESGNIKAIKVYNSSCEPTFIGEKKIANGSIGAIGGTMSHYSNANSDGISLWLDCVQLVEFIEYDEEIEFDIHEGGFEQVEDESGFKLETESVPAPKGLPSKL